MRFECRPLELHSKDRKSVVGYGVEWTEARVFVEWVYECIAKWLCVVAFGLFWSAIVFAPQFGANAFVPLAVGAAVATGFAYMFIRSSQTMPGKKQSMEFGKNGDIYASWDGQWTIEVADIRSVEAEQLKPTKPHEPQACTHGVRMITRRGRVLHVARDIAPDDAICLAVMLSEAIEAVKYVDQRPQPAKVNGTAAEVW